MRQGAAARSAGRTIDHEESFSRVLVLVLGGATTQRLVLDVEGQEFDHAVSGELGIDAQGSDEDSDRDKGAVVRPTRDRLKQIVPLGSDVTKEPGQLVQLEVQPGRFPAGTTLDGELPVQVFVEAASGPNVSTLGSPTHLRVTTRQVCRAAPVWRQRDAGSPRCSRRAGPRGR